VEKLWNSPYTPYIAAILSGVLLSLCFPSLDLNQWIWVWQMPLLFVLWFRGAEGNRRWLWGLRVGYVAGFTFFAINLAWIRYTAGAGWLVLALYLAIYFGLWGAFASTIGRLDPDKIKWRKTVGGRFGINGEIFKPSLHVLWIATLNASCWVALEWVRGWMFTGFGWNGLGVALHNSPALIQSADLVGVAGLSFLVVFCSTIGLGTLARFRAEMGKGRLRPHLDFMAAMTLLMANFFYGVSSHRRHPVDEPVEVKMALIQGNIPMSIRNDADQGQFIIDRYAELTSLYAGQDFDVIVWPETVLPTSFFDAFTQRFLNTIMEKGDFQFILGTELDSRISETEGTIYNSMVVCQNGTANYRSYSKCHLVPFGEYVPFRAKIPLLHLLLGRVIPGDFNSGLTVTDNLKPLPLLDPDVEIIPSICFEDTVGRLTREFVKDGAQKPQFMLNITNDAWFEESAGSMQHLANAKFRSVEIKRPLVRCANSGVTCVVDQFGSLMMEAPNGQLIERIFRDPQTQSTFVHGGFPILLQVDSKPATTVYAKYGDWFAILLFVFIAGLVGWRIWKAQKARKAAASQGKSPDISLVDPGSGWDS